MNRDKRSYRKIFKNFNLTGKFLKLSLAHYHYNETQIISILSLMASFISPLNILYRNIHHHQKKHNILHFTNSINSQQAYIQHQHTKSLNIINLQLTRLLYSLAIH